MGSKNNKSSSKIKCLDLHGYKEDEVVDAIDQFLVKNQNQRRLMIMTGKGQGIVKKATVKYLKMAGYPWEYEKVNGKPNTGCLIIIMD